MTSSSDNEHFAFDSLKAIRNRLLDLTGRNRLLNFKHGRSSLIRVIDEMPNQLAADILTDRAFTFIQVPEPDTKALIKAGFIGLDEKGQEVRIKPGPSAREWAKYQGLNTDFELLKGDNNVENKHQDRYIQSMLYPRELESQLRNIRARANTAIEETGANILYMAFGFLQWFEDDKPDMPKLAPLYLIPVRIERAALDKKLGIYTYNILYTGEDIVANLSLKEKLKFDFSQSLPELEPSMLPEAYFELIENQLLQNKPQWQIKRYVTLAMFDFGKLLMYLDLDPNRWPQGQGNIQNHPIITQFFDNTGSEATIYDSPVEYPIDELQDVHQLYPLIDDADSSQHSALVDAIKGENLVIEGPPGTGKSQTITNLIAAAIAQGKKVLFVAEKLAALQVVKSRLERAGLGDFCLELHSHKTQKKQVYQNIGQRLDNQHKYANPKQIELEINQYEAHKQTLKNYVELINQSWKNTGQTIHQIFTASTRYREAYAQLPLDQITVGDITGDNYDSARARETEDELRRYADVFDQLSQQVGHDAPLDQHPWFGVNNQSIELFDGDEVCAVLGAWQSTLLSLKSRLEDICQYLETDEPLNSLEHVAQLLADLTHLPAPTGDEHFDALKKMDSTQRTQVSKWLASHHHWQMQLVNLQQVFEPDLLANPDALSEMQTAFVYLEKILNNDNVSLSDAFTASLLLNKQQVALAAINKDKLTVQQQMPQLAGYFDNTMAGLAQLQGFLQFTADLDTTLMVRRNPRFDEDALDKLLPVLQARLAVLLPIRQQLRDTIDLDRLPCAADLLSIKQIIAQAGFFKWFSSRWRAARLKLLSLVQGLEPKLASVLPLMDVLITYQQTLEQMHEEQAFEQYLGDEFKGVRTDIDSLFTLRFWYQSIRARYGVGFGKQVALAESLFNLPIDTFKGIKHLASTSTHKNIKQFNQHLEILTKVLKSPCLNDPQSRLQGIDELIGHLQQNLTIAQQATKKDLSLGELREQLALINGFFDFEQTLKQQTLLAELFGDECQLDLTDNSEAAASKVSVVQSTVELSSAIDHLQNSVLKSALKRLISSDFLQGLNQRCADLALLYQNQNQAREKFALSVELNVADWTANTTNTLDALIQRNALALTQPRWLINWVDFIRLSARLGEKGLESLLRQVETGQIPTGDVAAVYLCLVYECLSGEVIEQTPALSHFSGIEHNAVAHQFGQTDDQLKVLQRQKIAWQVAQNATVAGVTAGRVANLTEMALINNEVKKKTRHVSVRQLIRRAGQSLVALKPCFMMGPHSVAQYLAPGKLDFDLIVMDEASQIKPEDALGTVARGRQLVVVGDPKQLPPTSFFDKTVVDESEQVVAIEQSQSILDVSLPLFVPRRLRWHYRSRHESLIAFSNQTFYQGDLVVFPSPNSSSDEYGIKFTHVKRGRFVNQRNIEEAQVIAHAVQQHLLHRPEESLGLVAMSSTQREQIERCVEGLAKEDPVFCDALEANNNTNEPLFIKNLENVQGDERDVIYISITYGPSDAGASEMPQRFGPINTGAGGRRLNVLFTRSKKRMHVFASMTEAHVRLTEKSGEGVRALKSFLAFAQTGKISQPNQQSQNAEITQSHHFAKAVTDALAKAGFDCVPRVGVAGYFLDLAVVDPNAPGRYLMAIECDGESYYRAKSVRDRDRLRRSVLQGLGWQVRRIWCTDWFKNPEAQLQPIIEQLQQLQKAQTIESPTVTSELQEIAIVNAFEDELLLAIDEFSHIEGTLQDKLQRFDEHVIATQHSDVGLGHKLLRPAMIEAFVQFRPVSKSEYREFIPAYLRENTDIAQIKFLGKVLSIIGEDEDEKNVL